MKKLLTFILFLVAVHSSHACFPDNELHLQKNKTTASNISRLEFESILKDFESTWQSYVAKKSGKKLIVKGHWDKEKVNAYATKDDDNNPLIIINGAMARFEDMNEDSLILILCHELGHHFGGAPKSFRGRSQRRSWSSAEGQADYFATSFCMEKSLKERDWGLVEKLNLSEESYRVLGCESSNCRRIVQASYIVSKMFAALKMSWEEPSLERTASYEVSQTNFKHPEPQCRLDTYIAGMNCGQKYSVDFDDKDPFFGVCEINHTRPLCWFSPKVY